jgi:hypothetical protein
MRLCVAGQTADFLERLRPSVKGPRRPDAAAIRPSSLQTKTIRTFGGFLSDFQSKHNLDRQLFVRLTSTVTMLSVGLLTEQISVTFFMQWLGKQIHPKCYITQSCPIYSLSPQLEPNICNHKNIPLNIQLNNLLYHVGFPDGTFEYQKSVYGYIFGGLGI